MSSDSSNTSPEEIARQVFAETRASTLISKTPPTADSENLAPTPEIEAADVAGETALAPEPQSENEPALAQPAVAPETISASKLRAPESEPDENTPPQIALDQQPADVTDPALALTFAPAPDAPFQSSVTVGIRGGGAEARIFYTLDGTAPDENSTLYTPEKILLTQSATLSACAVAAGARGPICSADYIVSKPLWQENEPADQTDPTKHKESANLSAPDHWQTGAASVRGKLHAHRALWREDAFALGNAENTAGSWSICIVSDGAGSAPLSRVGSNIACQIALGDAMGSLGEIEAWSDDINADLPRIKTALVGAAKAALQALRDEAAARNQPLSAFAATLLILVRRALGEAQLCAALQVGDGAIALDCASGLKLLGAADHGQHSSETRFLTTSGMEDDFANRVKFSLPQDLRATLVVSDGVSDDYFPEDKRLTEVFEAARPLAQNAEDAGAALLEWLGYEKKGSSDDRTIVLSWPVQPGAVAALEVELSESLQVPASEDSAGLTSSSNRVSEVSARLEEDVSSAPETALAAPDAATAPASTEMSDGA